MKTDRADVSTVFDQQQVSSLPVGDQNFTNLQLLLPGAQLLGWSHAADENPQGSKQIQVDGQAFGGTAFELDGTDNQDPILGIIVINPAMDAVTETKITTQNFDAELGKAVSAVVTAQTRPAPTTSTAAPMTSAPATPTWRAIPYSAAPGPELPIPSPDLKNRFGGSIGGPILKDKASSSSTMKASARRSARRPPIRCPPQLLTETCLGTTPAAGSGGIAGCDFSEYDRQQLGAQPELVYPTTAAQAAAAGIAIGTPFPDNVIPASQFRRRRWLSSQLLEPTRPASAWRRLDGSVDGLDKNYNESGTGLFNSNQWTVRVRLHAQRKDARL